MTAEQLKLKRVHWPKLAMFGFAILLPQIAVAWSNREVFPDALWIATIIVVVIIGISAISTYFSGNAAPQTRRYALWHDFAVAAMTCVVLLFHFQVAREVSAGKEARTADEAKDRTRQQNLDREVQRQLALKSADAELERQRTEKLREERRVLVQLPPSQRRAMTNTTPAPTTSETPAFTTNTGTVEPTTQPVVIRTPEEVRAAWFGWLFWASAIEIVIAVLGGMILMMVWQWDVDGDGIADHLQNRQPAIGFNAPAPPVYAKSGNPPPTHRGNFYDPTDPK